MLLKRFLKLPEISLSLSTKLLELECGDSGFFVDFVDLGVLPCDLALIKYEKILQKSILKILRIIGKLDGNIIFGSSRRIQYSFRELTDRFQLEFLVKSADKLKRWLAFVIICMLDFVH